MKIFNLFYYLSFVPFCDKYLIATFCDKCHGKKFRAVKASLRARLYRAKMNALNALKSQRVAQLLLLLGVYIITSDEEQTGPKVPRSRKQRIPDKERTRMNWSERVATLTDAEFMRTYRVDKVLFNEILDNIHVCLEVAEPAMARSSAPVSPELKLSMTLRWLAGGSYLDIYQLHGVSYTQFNNSLLRAVLRPFSREEIHVNFAP